MGTNNRGCFEAAFSSRLSSFRPFPRKGGTASRIPHQLINVWQPKLGCLLLVSVLCSQCLVFVLLPGRDHTSRWSCWSRKTWTFFQFFFFLLKTGTVFHLTRSNGKKKRLHNFFLFLVTASDVTFFRASASLKKIPPRLQIWGPKHGIPGKPLGRPPVPVPTIIFSGTTMLKDFSRCGNINISSISVS